MDRIISFTDQTLQDYVDGVLDAATCRALEAALQDDRGLARRLARIRPAEGASAVAGSAKVVQLAGVRAERAAAARKAGKQRRSVREWVVVGLVALMAIAMCALGLYAVKQLLPNRVAAATPATPLLLATQDGSLLAQGALLVALNQQAGGTASAGGELRIGQSFISQEGEYCRSFSLLGKQQDLTGLACQQTGAWQIPLLVQNGRAVPALGSHRSATGDMPKVLQEAISQRRAGELLDAQGEEQALQRRWQR
jgi:hypothetical protein